MKNIIKNIILVTLKIDLVWFFARPFVFVMNKLIIYRRLAIPSKPIEKELYTDLEKSIMNILGDPIVKNGNFKGLIYPSYTSFCSTIFPKIIGSYELELNEIIKKQCATNYSEIIDVGCAEGYYAIGFARNIPTATVYAYDTNEFARAFCSEMAELNKVNNVKVESFCSEETLKNFVFTGKGLIISDCEAYEKYLFTKNNISNLLNCDILIETHDFIDPNISGNLIALFSDTHHVEVIGSVDDTIKSRTYHYQEVQNLDIITKRKMFAEGRPGLMEWLLMTPKASL